MQYDPIAMAIGVRLAVLAALLAASFTEAASLGGLKGHRVSPEAADVVEEEQEEVEDDADGAEVNDPMAADPVAMEVVSHELNRTMLSMRDQVHAGELALTRARVNCIGKAGSKASAEDIELGVGSSCQLELRRASARLARLLAAQEQLEKKGANAEKVEQAAMASGEQVARLESQLAELRARARVAHLGTEAALAEVKRLDGVASAYKARVGSAEERIDKVRRELEDAREDEMASQDSTVAFMASARGVERGAEAPPDLASRAELARAVRAELTATAFYKRARLVRRRAGAVLARQQGKQEARNGTSAAALEKQQQQLDGVLLPNSQVLLHDDHGMDAFGRTSDFGGRLPMPETPSSMIGKTDANSSATLAEDEADSMEVEDDEEEEDDDNAENDIEEPPATPSSSDAQESPTLFGDDERAQSDDGPVKVVRAGEFLQQARTRTT